MAGGSCPTDEPHRRRYALIVEDRPTRFVIVYGWHLDFVTPAEAASIQRFIDTGAVAFIRGLPYFDRVAIWTTPVRFLDA
jgi:hypothetical protein